MLKIKRVYEKPEKSDGLRILVDRLWPRGVGKKEAKIDHWMKEIAPSSNLRKWFAHKDERWPEFKRRYFKELKDKNEPLKQLKDSGKNKNVTLLYGAKDTERNNAKVLLEFISKQRR
ncbi:MAG: DUF488 domain-containing protein [Candidatus Omnitrophota bacterium]